MDTKRKLQSIGITVFVTYYNEFKRFSSEDLLKYLLENQVSENEAGARRRIFSAKQIFRANLQKEALDLCVNARKVSPEIIKKAKELRMLEK